MAEVDSPSVGIHSWDASYYDNRSHKWIYGKLILLPLSISFETNNCEDSVQKDQSCDQSIALTHIRHISKARSSLLFASIVISTDKSDTHWFSSFSNRDETYLFLKHFVSAFTTESLTSSSTGTHIPDGKRTELGSKLLQSVNDSQNTLQNAAENLVKQGHQLSSASATVGMMHQDLKIARRITKGLDSWFGLWKMPKVYTNEKMVLVKDIDVPDVQDTEALCSFITHSTFGPQKECVFRVSKEGLTVMDMKQKVLHNFRWRDVSRIRVVSPWEIMVTQFSVGKPDFSYTVVAVTMPKVLNKLEKFGSNKLEYMTPTKENFHRSNQTLSSSSSSSYSSGSHGHENSIVKDLGTPVTGKHADHIDVENFCQAKTQVPVQKQVVSDLEIDELSSNLKKLKCLALDVGAEEDRQLQLIDGLTSAVTRADDKVTGLNRKIDKMMK